MIYTILFLADIHWGAITPAELYSHLKFVLQFMQKIPMDLVVLGGDYFDSRLNLNSKSAQYAIKWMYELYDCCKATSVKALRMIKGTEAHDNAQLHTFDALTDDFFRIFDACTVEETLPGLNCIYCPDENLPWNEYETVYAENLLKDLQMGFFHGSFDSILPEIALQISEEQNRRSVIFPLRILAERIHGPLLAGHWHNPYYENPLYYAGSYDTWAHGEDPEKGFLIARYNTENHSYQVIPVRNPYQRVYDTIIYEMISPNLNDINAIHDAIKEKKSKAIADKQDHYIRVLFRVRTEDLAAQSLIQGFQHQYLDDKFVKITIVNYVKEKSKKEKKRQLQEVQTQYPFLFEKGPMSKKIQEFLLAKQHKEYPIDVIRNYILKYQERDEIL